MTAANLQAVILTVPAASHLIGGNGNESAAATEPGMVPASLCLSLNADGSACLGYMPVDHTSAHRSYISMPVDLQLPVTVTQWLPAAPVSRMLASYVPS